MNADKGQTDGATTAVSPERDQAINQTMELCRRYWPQFKIARYDDWFEALSRVSVDSIIYAMAELRKSHGEKPPTPGQFRKKCAELARYRQQMDDSKPGPAHVRTDEEHERGLGILAGVQADLRKMA